MQSRQSIKEELDKLDSVEHIVGIGFLEMSEHLDQAILCIRDIISSIDKTQ